MFPRASSWLWWALGWCQRQEDLAVAWLHEEASGQARGAEEPSAQGPPVACRQGGSESQNHRAARWVAAGLLRTAQDTGGQRGRRWQEASGLAASPRRPPPLRQCLWISPEAGLKSLGSGLCKEQCFPREGAGLYQPCLLSQ